MCTVLHYLYACGHYVARRSSSCGGTKFKETRSGSRRAACTAEAYITIKRLSECNKCLQKAWDMHWETKLDKAKAFHVELVKKGLPGAQEVSQLVKKLEEEFELESWDLKNIIPYGHKARVQRVRPAEVEKTKLPVSPLRREVQPQDVVLPRIKEPEIYDDDDGWEPSTDPMHPISTNYEHPLDGIDDKYVLELLTEEELGNHAAIENDGFDPSATSWGWGDDSAHGEADHEADHEDQGFQSTNKRTSATDQTKPSLNTHQLMAWGTAAEDTTSSGEISCVGLRTEGDVRTERIEAVLQAFWKVVNATDDQQPQQSLSADQFTGTVYMNNAVPGNPGSDTDSAASTTSEIPQYGWTDGPADAPPPPPFITHGQSETSTTPSKDISPCPTANLRRGNSTYAKYDAFRKAIRPSKEEDPKGYYEKWLLECRLEIREIVGPEGPRIRDPPKWRTMGP